MNVSHKSSAGRSAPSAESINECAVEWISRRDAGLNGSEEAEFRAWLAADSRHAGAVEALQPAWSAMNRLRHLGRGSDLRNHVERVVARRNRRRTTIGIASLAAAAMIAVAFFISRPAASAPTIAVRPDRQLLPDGSTIELNAGANVAIEFTSETRGVRLVSGEALFHVTHDGARPFIVTAGRVAVRAVGTVFTVRLEPKTVDVLVAEGRVAVKRTNEKQPEASKPGSETNDSAEPAQPPRVTGAAESISMEKASSGPLSPDLMLDAGERLVVPITAPLLQPLEPQPISPGEVATALAWRNRRVEFNGTSVAEAVELFNRDNSIQLSVANPETGALRITGVFWTNDPEAFARVVKTSLGLNASRVNDEKIIFSK